MRAHAITGQIVPLNPAAAVRGPKHVVKTGKTPVLEGEEWRTLIESIPTEALRDLRDRALIATLTYSFARITAALRMKVEDFRPKGAGWQVQLHEKGGKQHAMPCHYRHIQAALPAADTDHLTSRSIPPVGRQTRRNLARAPIPLSKNGPRRRFSKTAAKLVRHFRESWVEAGRFKCAEQTAASRRYR